MQHNQFVSVGQAKALLNTLVVGECILLGSHNKRQVNKALNQEQHKAPQGCGANGMTLWVNHESCYRMEHLAGGRGLIERIT